VAFTFGRNRAVRFHLVTPYRRFENAKVAETYLPARRVLRRANPVHRPGPMVVPAPLGYPAVAVPRRANARPSGRPPEHPGGLVHLASLRGGGGRKPNPPAYMARRDMGIRPPHRGRGGGPRTNPTSPTSPTSDARGWCGPRTVAPN